MSEVPSGTTPTEGDQPVAFAPGTHPVPELFPARPSEPFSAEDPAPFSPDHPAPAPSSAAEHPAPLSPEHYAQLPVEDLAPAPADSFALLPVEDPADPFVPFPVNRPTLFSAGRDTSLPAGRPTIRSGGRPTLEATGEWPAPDPAGFAEEDTDPTGFTPISGGPYPPATDPFDDPAFTSAYPLPGWSAPPETEPAPPAARRRRPVLIAIAAFAGLAGLIAAFLLVPRGRPDPSAAAATARPTEAATAGHANGNDNAGNDDAAGSGRTVTGARGGLDTASFDILDSATLIQLTAADLGDDLFRVSTPANSGLTPSAEQRDGAVKLSLRSDGSGGSAAVTVQLSSAVRWSLRLDGGTAQSRLDLTGADLAALDLNGGASRIDLLLPDPHGLLPVRMTGGVDQFQVTLAGTTPVRVRVQSGAGQVTLDGTTHKGIAPGRSFTANDWSGTSGIDLEAVAGLATLTVHD